MPQYKSRKFAVAKNNSGNGDAVFINDQAAIAAALTTADTVDFHLPKGIEVSYLKFLFSALAASGLAGSIGFVPTVGTTVVANGVAVPANLSYFRAAGNFGLTASGFECDFIPVTFEEDVILRITITVNAVTGIAGTAYATIGGNQIGVR